ncbi:DUF2213 domain-containing protein [Crateriforma conspicua]|uniref:DUF2213 domain-containing protein n=1 Tax=Crateriforma conspicua TaxID=2527996 RepID=UPI00118A5D77|nr:DUF2213 domain-containing protein [Crateriforma conspicua]QDV63043.1 hypothetical protein Mal65_21820 [Crateriforma conspicua]
MLTVTSRFVANRAAHRSIVQDGNEYYVVPVVMIVEGVHHGSNGPFYYSKNELKKSASAWNMKPIVVNHPADSNGRMVSADSKEIRAKQEVGFIVNARFENNKLVADACIEKERAFHIDPRICRAIESRQLMEVSTGLFHDVQYSPGQWAGKSYEFEATEHRPDHLAILPDGVGACSVSDGAGLLQANQQKVTGLGLPKMMFGPHEMPPPHQPTDKGGLPLPEWRF